MGFPRHSVLRKKWQSSEPVIQFDRVSTQKVDGISL